MDGTDPIKRIASVYVEVAAQGVDRPFDYEVPEELHPLVQVGSRVRVPFGPRKLMGYVVAFPTTASTSRLKPILDVMDLEPPLTPELVRLARWVAATYLCPVVTALQAMLPAVLKGKHKRVFQLADPGAVPLLPEAEQSLLERLKQKKEWPQEALMALPGITPSLVRQWVKEGILRGEDRVGDRSTRKTRIWIVPVVSAEALKQALESIPSRAERQRQLIRHFIEQPKEQVQSELLAQLGIGRSSLDRLVEKGLLKREEREEYRDPFEGRSFERTHPLPLTDEQRCAYTAITSPLKERRWKPVLLHGVTGSGKTEVYLQAIDCALTDGRETIVLVPEISLTPQMVRRFKGRFGERVAVLHSGLSDGERYDEWRKIRQGEAQVVVGARSAVFAPFSNLGLIIIDEEHESSYKQEEQPRYHARDVAIRRAQEHGAVLVIGSATPSVESYFKARKGTFEWVTMKQRVQGNPLPPVEVVDMREELKDGNRSIFSRALRQALEACVDRGEQAVLLLNRRGYSTFVLCRDCGEAIQCPHCDISLTFHRTNQTLRCHYCGYAEQVPDTCPACSSSHIRYFGTGTQRVEEELARLMPGLRVIRMDVDTTGRKGAHERLLSAFGQGKADILLGTQMIAKGLDFPRVSLVGVIAADTMLHLPDYRAGERTFQLLTQVAGRAGRHEIPGKVVVQTYTPEHESIQLAASHEGEEFYRRECRLRMAHRYPPFSHVVTCLLSHPDRTRVTQAGVRAAQTLRPLLPPGAELLGPVPAPVPRVQDRYRIQIMIKTEAHMDESRGWLEALRQLRERKDDPDLRVSIDRDGLVPEAETTGLPHV
ncbi:primosomal protein N' [Desmospora profundinema]|uniref:Replication restart protein PriA n=1 Tax=Desmospora profundinema TaxID=1571184 RepID=A0ABU1ISQ5_9BACL|nr:primosomal protein N' [Desmospora profundinema]MDR6227229.1 primosomal protein N' (replication factor Y) [Desmospora profundinema]